MVSTVHSGMQAVELISRRPNSRALWRGRWKEAKAQLADLLLDADRAIDAISDLRVRLVLKMYYLDKISTKDIADRMHYSKQHVNHLMNRGYQLMEMSVEKIPA